MASDTPFYNIYVYFCHTVDLKQQNRLKVGTDKPKLKLKIFAFQWGPSQQVRCVMLYLPFNGDHLNNELRVL